MRRCADMGDTSGTRMGPNLIHLGTKFNHKLQPARIVLRIDLAARIAVKGQDVLAGMKHSRWNGKMRLLVGVPARDLRPQEHAARCIFELNDVAVKTARRYKVKIQKKGFIGADRECAAFFAGRVDPSQSMRAE